MKTKAMVPKIGMLSTSSQQMRSAPRSWFRLFHSIPSLTRQSRARTAAKMKVAVWMACRLCKAVSCAVMVECALLLGILGRAAGRGGRLAFPECLFLCGHGRTPASEPVLCDKCQIFAFGELKCISVAFNFFRYVRGERSGYLWFFPHREKAAQKVKKGTCIL